MDDLTSSEISLICSFCLMPEGCKRLNYLIFPYKNLGKAAPSLIRTIKSIEQLLKITGNEISFPLK